MKQNKISSKLIIWCSFFIAAPLFYNSVLALPQVESRTGEPIVKEKEVFIDSGYNHAIVSNNSQQSLQQLNQIESLQQEIRELRGQLEVQEHEIKRLTKSQQDLYLDLERRLNQLQKKSSTATPIASEDQGFSNTAQVSSQQQPTDLNLKYEPKAVREQKNIQDTKIESEKLSTSNEKNVNPEQAAYQIAYDLVRSKNYTAAVEELQKFVKQYPSGQYTANSHYWLGEVYLIQWQNDKKNSALLDKSHHEFNSIVTHFPEHYKAVDAWLKLGLIEIDRGNTGDARKYLSEVTKRYSGSTAAKIAETKLQRL